MTCWWASWLSSWSVAANHLSGNDLGVLLVSYNIWKLLVKVGWCELDFSQAVHSFWPFKPSRNRQYLSTQDPVKKLKIWYCFLCESLPEALSEEFRADWLRLSAVWALGQAAGRGRRRHIYYTVADHLHKRLDFIRGEIKGPPQTETHGHIHFFRTSVKTLSNLDGKGIDFYCLLREFLCVEV